MRWSCLQFNVLLLPESYQRLPAETRWKPLSPPPYTARAKPWRQQWKTILNLDHTRRTRHQCDFPVLPWFCPVWRFHVVVEWISIIHGCTHSWRFSTFYKIVYSSVKRTPESEKKKTYVFLIERKIKKKLLVYVPGTYIPGIPFCSSTRRRCEL